MRYHFDKPEIYLSLYGERYICEHPVYNSCTLYRIEERGLVIHFEQHEVPTIDYTTSVVNKVACDRVIYQKGESNVSKI